MTRKTLAEIAAGVSIAIVFAACGALQVDGTLSGSTTNAVPVSGTINVVMPASDFIPFFLGQCAELSQGQTCYNSDPTLCAQCLANALEDTLNGVSPSPTPSPSGGG